MLASRSDVFRAMFAHDMKENQLGVVQLDDTEPQVVKQFLAFIYTDHFDDTSFATVSKLLPLAEKYNVKRLCSLCGQVWTMERSKICFCGLWSISRFLQKLINDHFLPLKGLAKS